MLAFSGQWCSTALSIPNYLFRVERLILPFTRGQGISRRGGIKFICLNNPWMGEQHFTEDCEDKDTDITRSIQEWVKQKEKEAPGKHVTFLLYSHTLPDHSRTRADFSGSIHPLNLETSWSPYGRYGLLLLLPTHHIPQFSSSGEFCSFFLSTAPVTTLHNPLTD